MRAQSIRSTRHHAKHVDASVDGVSDRGSTPLASTISKIIRNELRKNSLRIFSAFCRPFGGISRHCRSTLIARIDETVSNPIFPAHMASNRNDLIFKKSSCSSPVSPVNLRPSREGR